MLFWLVFGWASNVLGIWVTSLIFDGVTYDDKVWVLALAGLVLFLANAIIRPIVIILTLPAVILTLGILLLFINAFTLWAPTSLTITRGADQLGSYSKTPNSIPPSSSINAAVPITAV